MIRRSFVHRFGLLAIGATLCATTALAGCAPGSNGESGAQSQSGTAEVSTDVAAAGKVTLNLTDYWSGTEGEWIEKMVSNFEAKYPNVTINREAQDWNQLNSTLNLRLQEDSSPDIATANKGWESLGTIAQASLVINLDRYAAAYDWNSKVPDTLQRQYKFTTDFATMGKGSWFATPIARTQLIGLYYNVDKLNSLGIDEPPTTTDELDKDAALAAAAGETPFYNGSQSSAEVPVFGLQAVYADKTQFSDFVYGESSVTAKDTGFSQALEKVSEWTGKGYFPKGFEGLDRDTAASNFLKGDGVFRWDYTGSLSPDNDKKFGYVQIAADNGAVATMGTTPATMVISSRCKHPDVAAAFLDYLMSEEAAQAAVDQGLVPGLTTSAATDDNTSLMDSQIKASQAINSDDGYLPFFDWTTSTMLDTVNQNIQSLYAGRTTVPDIIKAVDADRNAFLAER